VLKITAIRNRDISTNGSRPRERGLPAETLT
jgi:hypothetical protein